MISPAMTSTSLLARAIFFPDLIAASVGARPVLPEVAMMTMSTSGWVAISSIDENFILSGRLNLVDEYTSLGWNWLICLASKLVFLPPANPTIMNLPGKPFIMSRVCWIGWRQKYELT